MFCGKCGTKNEDNAVFCSKCGEELRTYRMEQEKIEVSVNNTIQEKKKHQMVGMIAVAVCAVVVIAIACLIFSGRSYKATVKQFVNALVEADAESFIEVLPDEVIQYLMDEEKYSYSDIKDMYEEGLKEEVEDLEDEFGEDWDLSYEILDIDDLSEKELKELQEDYEKFEVEIEIADGKTVEVKLIMKNGDDEETVENELPLIKVGKSWYIDVVNLDLF